jgi:hypothetical protein
MIDRSLHAGISDNEIFPNEISRGSGKQNNSVRVPDDDVLLNNVAGNGSAAGRTDTEVIALG